MSNFNIKITEGNGDVNIYTDASKINITNNKIEIDYEDTNATHQMDCVDEVIIKPIR